MQFYHYTVLPEHQCAGLKMDIKSGCNKTNRWKGWIDYSHHYKEFYLTTDGITYTSVNHAKDIEKVKSEDEDAAKER